MSGSDLESLLYTKLFAKYFADFLLPEIRRHYYISHFAQANPEIQRLMTQAMLYR